MLTSSCNSNENRGRVEGPWERLDKNGNVHAKIQQVSALQSNSTWHRTLRSSQVLSLSFHLESTFLDCAFGKGYMWIDFGILKIFFFCSQNRDQAQAYAWQADARPLSLLQPKPLTAVYHLKLVNADFTGLQQLPPWAQWRMKLKLETFLHFT